MGDDKVKEDKINKEGKELKVPKDEKDNKVKVIKEEKSTKDITEVKEEENDTLSKVKIVETETKSRKEVKEEILASMDEKNNLVEKVVDINKKELTDVANKPVGNLNIESEGKQLEKEVNITKLIDISKEVDEG